MQHRRLLVFVAGLLCHAAACGSPSPERIAGWKATPEGREKLVEVLRDGSAAVPTRAAAAAALTEVGWVDRVESAVAGLPLDQRGALVPAAATQIARLLDAPDAAQAWDAREALLGLRRHAMTDEGARVIDGFLLPALERDLRANRATGGRHTLKEMLVELGPASLPVVNKVLADDKGSFAVAVEVLEKLGDKAGREAGSAALVGRARAMNPVPPELWKALSTLGGPAAASYLEEVIEKGDADTRLRAAEAMATIRPESTLLPFALKIAKDRAQPPVVREQLLTLAQKIGTEDARKGMIDIIAFEPDPEFRFKTLAALVACGAGRQLLPALEAFPPRAAYQPEEIKTRMVDVIAKVGYGARADVFKALESRSPLARLVALWVLEKTNFGSDAKQVEKLTKDQGKVQGLPTGATIGSEARRIAATLKKQTT